MVIKLENIESLRTDEAMNFFTEIEIGVFFMLLHFGCTFYQKNYFYKNYIYNLGNKVNHYKNSSSGPLFNPIFHPSGALSSPFIVSPKLDPLD